MAYDIELAPIFPPLTHIDVDGFAAEHEPWTNRTLSIVGDSVLRVGILEGEFHWHHHDVEDELFLVLDGELLIDLRDRDEPVVLGRHQAFMVPHGVEHRTRAPRRTVVLMIEPAGVQPTGS
jgi:mannose-6-phosphate isomerase-like protein (cupin superfamily)